MIIILFVRLLILIVFAWAVFDFFLPLFMGKDPFWITKSLFKRKTKGGRGNGGKKHRSNL